MNLLKKIVPFLSVIIAIGSVFVMTRTPGIPTWQIIAYSLVIPIPCYLILCWKQFDLYFGFAPLRATREDRWLPVTAWIGWLLLAMMLLVNHFARPPLD